MNNKKLLTFLIVIFALGAVLAVLFSIVLKDRSSDIPDNPSSTLAPAENTPYAVTVTFGEEPTTCVNITWHSAENAEGSVTYSRDGENEESIAVVKAETGDSDYIYRAYITGLLPGGKYNYSVKTGNFESETYTFKTQKDSAEFNFIIVSDMQGQSKSDYSTWGNLIKAAAKRDYDFILNLGDSVEDGKSIEQWNMLFDSADGIMENSSVINILGNQDKKNVLSYYTYGSSAETPTARENFSFTVGNVHFTVLNSGDGDKDLSKTQLKWLKSELSNNAGCFNIVCIHKAPYSNYNHANDSEIIAIREQITPICEEYGANIVLSGHDHAFYRSKIGSVTYFMSSSSGEKQHHGNLINNEIPFDVSTTLKMPTYTYVSVGSSDITFTTYTVSSITGEALFDEFSLPLH